MESWFGLQRLARGLELKGGKLKLKLDLCPIPKLILFAMNSQETNGKMFWKQTILMKKLNSFIST